MRLADFRRAISHSIARTTAGVIIIMHINYPVNIHDVIMRMIVNHARIINIPGALSPWTPPGGIIGPTVR